MLKQRVLTAIALLTVLLGVLFAPMPWTFAVFMAVLVSAGAWEWARLSGFTGHSTWICAAVAFAGCIALLMYPTTVDPHMTSIVIAVWVLMWLLCAVYLLRAGVGVWSRIPSCLRMSMGFLTLWATWVAAVRLHGQFGVGYLLSVMALVWVADSAAYFAGRAFGKRKLAPQISPGKRWAGVVGGVIGVQALAIACCVLAGSHTPNFYSDIQQRVGWPALMIITAIFTALSILGDLVESLMKRGMGVKDSSQLLPGHGGVLDRVDALLPVLPCALAVALWLNR